MYKLTRSEAFWWEVNNEELMLGTFWYSAHRYYECVISTKAQKSMKIIRIFTENLLSDFDYIIMPTTPTPRRSNLASIVNLILWPCILEDLIYQFSSFRIRCPAHLDSKLEK